VLQSERRYCQLIELAPIGITVVGTDSHLQSANPAFWQMLGSPPAQQSDILTFPPLIEAGLPPTCTAAWKPAAPLCTEHSYTGPSGQRIHLRCHLTPLPEEGAVLALFEDITVHKQVQGHLEQMQRTEALQRLAGVAHDLNNHLTVIHAYTDLLALDGDTSENQDLAAIRKAAHEIGSLAGQLLAFSREQPDQRSVSLDLNRLSDDSRDLLQLLAGKEVRIEMRLAPDLHSVEAVFGQIAQMLVSLATHAPCTTPCSRTLIFETANASKGVTLSVTDTGLELDEKTRVHLFEPLAAPHEDAEWGWDWL
jgi:signal transduction histidine kinase